MAAMETTIGERRESRRRRQDRYEEDRMGGASRGTMGLARGLGWFSIGLGALETAAPGAVTNWLGISRNDRLIRAMGARKIASGIGILTRSRPTRWMWGRVVGDVMDLAMLGTAARGSSRHDRIAYAAAFVAGALALDAVCAKQLRASEA